MKTAVQEVIEYLDGFLKIEDNLILKYKSNNNAVEDIKKNWEQINRIKEVCIKLLKKEEQQIIEAYITGIHTGIHDDYSIDPYDSNEIYKSANDYYNKIFNVEK